MMTIPLQNGQAHFQLRTTLSDRDVTIRADWLTRFGYYSVDIEVDGELAIAGKGLHPGVNLLRFTDVPGTLTISGEQPSPENIGRTAKLVYSND